MCVCVCVCVRLRDANRRRACAEFMQMYAGNILNK